VKLTPFLIALTALAIGVAQGQESSSVLFSESFENPRLLERGWYDGSKFTISSNQPFAGQGCIEYMWKAGGTSPASSSGTNRLGPIGKK
jgi:hypothetical protein